MGKEAGGSLKRITPGGGEAGGGAAKRGLSSKLSCSATLGSERKREVGRRGEKGRLWREKRGVQETGRKRKKSSGGTVVWGQILGGRERTDGTD